MADGISNDGDNAELRFRALTGASKPARSALGDAVLDGYFVEVKKASGSTINQVRAVKYITLVVFNPPSDKWFAVGPHDVVRLTANKSRGQHTENPFESSTLSLSKIKEFEVSSQHLLREAVLLAAHTGDKFPELQEEMTRILRESSKLAQDSIERVKRVLQQYDFNS